jgi:hypothetical protein
MGSGAVVDQARDHDAQVAGHRQTVLQAFKKSRTTWPRPILEEEIVLQSETLAAARLALQLVTNQYQPAWSTTRTSSPRPRR